MGPPNPQATRPQPSVFVGPPFGGLVPGPPPPWWVGGRGCPGLVGGASYGVNPCSIVDYGLGVGEVLEAVPL